MAMGSTTLVTFHFECPGAAHSIELLGSWDNFSKAYPLQRDRRRGHGIWSGCYTFDDIICDGDLKNLTSRRSGALKMGGTYWYYYKVDDEESFNPSEPSTTVCPLLPGQQLNILDVPREPRSRSNSQSSDAFTRNPQDKFLSPVPPLTTSSPRLGDLCIEPYSVPTLSPYAGPRSATYPPASQSISSGHQRQAYSAATSPQVPSTALLAEFKGLKDKLTQKRSASRSRTRSERKLEISDPVLVSTTAEDVQLIPLKFLQPPASSSRTSISPTESSSSPPVTATRQAYAPLGSHPVGPIQDFQVNNSLSAPVDMHQYHRRSRSRSHLPESTTTEFEPKTMRTRAQSAVARRTKIFSNEPWISSPKVPELEANDDELAASKRLAPILTRPAIALEPPPADARPTSSHGNKEMSGLVKSTLLVEKELPELPRFLTPAPLFACNSEAHSPHTRQALTEPDLEEDEDLHEQVSEIQILPKLNSRFSTWSSDSFALSTFTSDDEDTYSPTFSSFASNCSDVHSPARNSTASAFKDFAPTLLHSTILVQEPVDLAADASQPSSSSLSTSPPQLAALRSSSLGTNLFNLDIQHADSAPRRQAACFGLGFQGYALPGTETSSKTTITEQTLSQSPAVQIEQDDSVSHLEALVHEFGFLGESVV